jgi:hypothetical protein
LKFSPKSNMLPSFPSRRHPRSALLFSLSLALAACGGGGGSSTPPPVQPAQPAAATELTLSSSTTDVRAGGQPLALNTTLNGAGTVSWQLAAGAPGSLSATSGATVNYTPPASDSIYSGISVTITASSGSLSKSIVLKLLPDADRPGLTLLAGNIGGSSSLIRDGVGTAARFASIRSISSDASGNVYVADNDGIQPGRIRKIAADGSVTTLTSGPRGHSDGSQTQAAMEDLGTLTAAADGSIYFNDIKRQSLSSAVSEFTIYLRQLGTDGNIRTLTPAVSAIGGNAFNFSTPTLASPDGKVYRYSGARINIFKPDGSEQLLAGDADATQDSPLDIDGDGAAARFHRLTDLAAGKNGALFALDADGVRQITPAGVVTTLVTGLPTVSTSEPADTLYPQKIGADGSGNVLLLYTGSNPAYFEIRKVSGGAIVPWYKSGTPQDRYYIRPQYMHVLQNGTVVLIVNQNVMRISADGKASTLAGLGDDSYLAVDGDGAAARYVKPGMLAADQAGNVYSLDNADNGQYGTIVIRKTTQTGQVSTYANITLDLLGSVTGMLVTPAGQLTLSLTQTQGGTPYNNAGSTIYQVDAGNKLTLIAGAPGINTSGALQQDGTGAAARFVHAVLAGVDSAGNLYVQDNINYVSSAATVRKITPQGVVSTIAALPAGLGTAPDGNRYVITEHSISRVTPAGVSTVVAGSGLFYQQGIVLGPLPGLLGQVSSIVPTGPNSFAVASGSAILRLVLPK